MCALNLTFNYIEKLPINQLEQIPKQQLIQTAIEALDSGDDDTCRIYQFIFTSLVQLIPINEIEEVVLKKVLLSLEQLLTEKSTGIDDVKIITELMITLLENIYSILNANNEIIHIFCIKTTSRVSFRFLSYNYSFIKVQRGADGNNGIELLHQITQDLQESLIRILLSDFLEFQASVEDALYYRKLMLDFNRVTRSVNSLDEITLTAKIWKFFLKLSDIYASKYIKLTEKSFVGNENEDLFDWLESGVICLCEQIDKNMEEVLDQIQVTGDEIEVDIDRNLKLSLFFIKILSKLLIEYSEIALRGQRNFLKSFNGIKNVKQGLPAHYINDAEPIILLEEACTEIFDRIFHCPLFAQEIFRSQDIKSSVEILKRILRSPNRTESINELYLNKDTEKNIVHHVLFKSVPNCTYIDSIYEEVVYNLAALLIQCNGSAPQEEIIEEILVTAVLQNNALIGLVAVDVWLLYFKRCNSKMKQYYFNFWAQLNEEFTLPGVKPINVLLHILLRNLFNGLSGSDQSSIIENASTSWISTLTILGLERICEINEQKGKFICDQMFAQTDRILCHFQTTQNNESYYQLCKHLLFLSTSPAQFIKSVNERFVKQITNIALKLSQLNTEKHAILVQSMLRFLLFSEMANIDEPPQNSYYSNSIQFINSNKLYAQITQLELISVTKSFLSEHRSYHSKNKILTALLLQIYCRPNDTFDPVLEQQKQITLLDFHRNSQTRAILETDERFKHILSYLETDMAKSFYSFNSENGHTYFQKNLEKMEVAEEPGLDSNGQDNKFYKILSKLTVSNESELLDFLEALAEKVEDLRHIDGFSSNFGEFIRYACTNYFNANELERIKQTISDL